MKRISAIVILVIVLIPIAAIQINAASSESTFNRFQSSSISFKADSTFTTDQGVLPGLQLTQDNTIKSTYITNLDANFAYCVAMPWSAYRYNQITNINLKLSGNLRVGFNYNVPKIPKDAKNITVIYPIYPVFEVYSGISIPEQTSIENGNRLNVCYPDNFDPYTGYNFKMYYFAKGEGSTNDSVDPIDITYYSAFGLLVTFPTEALKINESGLLQIRISITAGEYNFSNTLNNLFDKNGISLWFHVSVYNTVLYTYDYDSSKEIQDAISQFEETVKDGFGDINSNLQGIQDTLDLIHDGQDVTNEKLQQLHEDHQHTNEKLDHLQDSLSNPSKDQQQQVDDLKDKYQKDEDRANQFLNDIDMAKPAFDPADLISNIRSYIDFTWIVAYLRISYDQPIMIAVYGVLGVLLIFGYLLYGKKH